MMGRWVPAMRLPRGQHLRDVVAVPIGIEFLVLLVKSPRIPAGIARTPLVARRRIRSDGHAPSLPRGATAIIANKNGPELLKAPARIVPDALAVPAAPVEPAVPAVPGPAAPGTHRTHVPGVPGYPPHPVLFKCWRHRQRQVRTSSAPGSAPSPSPGTRWSRRSPSAARASRRCSCVSSESLGMSVERQDLRLDGAERARARCSDRLERRRRGRRRRHRHRPHRRPAGAATPNFARTVANSLFSASNCAFTSAGTLPSPASWPRCRSSACSSGVSAFAISVPRRCMSCRSMTTS